MAFTAPKFGKQCLCVCQTVLFSEPSLYLVFDPEVTGQIIFVIKASLWTLELRHWC